MIGLLAFAAAVVATPEPVPASPYFLDESTLVQVVCGNEDWFGSAFFVGNGMFVTARHVVRRDDGKLMPCYVADHKPITVISIGSKLDYAVFKADYTPPYRMIISCRPFQEGRNYYAQGFASGNPWVVTQRLIGTGDHYANFLDPMFSGGTFVKGATTQGQSGGPVSDDDGLVTGIVSAGSVEGATQQIFVAFADTPFCKKA